MAKFKDFAIVITYSKSPDYVLQSYIYKGRTIIFYQGVTFFVRKIVRKL